MSPRSVILTCVSCLLAAASLAQVATARDAAELGGTLQLLLLDQRRAASAEDDPHRWLEEIEGDAALAWCREQNARTEAALGDPKQSDAYRKILAIADSKEKIPHVGRIGGTTGDAAAKVLYNFWQVRATLTAQLSRNSPQFSDAPHPSTQDAEHVRGLWRRCSLASYKSASPAWEKK